MGSDYENKVTEYYSQLSKQELLSLDFLTEIFSTEDDVLLQSYLGILEDRARELKCKSRFDKLIQAFQKERRKIAKENRTLTNTSSDKPEIARQTNFPTGCRCEFDALNCGEWIANSKGVRKVYANGESVASLYPIWPIRFLHNVHNSLEKVVLAYYKDRRWHAKTIYRSEIASVKKIVELSDYGIPVTAKNAPALIEYLQEVESFNEGIIPIKPSTTRMGWHGREFMPYSDQYEFDGDKSYNDLYNSLTSKGSYDAWLSLVRDIRANKRLEPLFFLAASFASPLLELLGVQSFAVDLWGDTEGGKTITTRLAASVWADSREGKYWGTFQSTEVAYEVKQGFLNNLPCFIDDSSNIKDKERFNYSTFVYNRCNEKGKSRSNISRGIELEYTWRQIILMTGEQPFITENAQGGAINRTLEISCGYTAIYQDPKGVCRVLDDNYGFAGRDWIEHIQALSIDYIKSVYERQLARVNALDKMQKQSNALAAILTADVLTEQMIFKDGITIDIEDAAEALTDKAIVSENERCYEYLQSQAVIYNAHFKPVYDDDNEAVYKLDRWGEYSDDESELYIIKTIFDKLCKDGGYSAKKFLDWAAKNSKIKTALDGRPTVVKYLSGCTPNRIRCVCLKLEPPEATDEEDYNKRDFMTAGIPF